MVLLDQVAKLAPDEQQILGDMLKAGLAELCKLRPKFPKLSCKASALKYLSLYLKVCGRRWPLSRSAADV